jgi:hypothetical protein
LRSVKGKPQARRDPSVTEAKFPLGILEGGEGRQAQGDVPVGECRLGSRRDIPPGTEAVPPPWKGCARSSLADLVSCEVLTM